MQDKVVLSKNLDSRGKRVLKSRPLTRAEIRYRSNLRHPGKEKEYHRLEAYKLERRYYRTKWRAEKESSKEFSISFDEYKQLILSGCYYCQKTLLNMSGSGLDRKDNTKGYSISNILPCCGECNYLRQDLFTIEETYVAIQAIKWYRGL